MAAPVEQSLREARDVCMSCTSGRMRGMHWTIMVPATSAEYQIIDIPWRPREDVKRGLRWDCGDVEMGVVEVVCMKMKMGETGEK